MQRKETYDTSGTLIRLRFFGGWDYANSLAADRDVAKAQCGSIRISIRLYLRCSTCAFWRSPPRGGLPVMRKVWVFLCLLERRQRFKKVPGLHLSGTCRLSDRVFGVGAPLVLPWLFGPFVQPTRCRTDHSIDGCAGQRPTGRRFIRYFGNSRVRLNLADHFALAPAAFGS